MQRAALAPLLHLALFEIVPRLNQIPRASNVCMQAVAPDERAAALATLADLEGVLGRKEVAYIQLARATHGLRADVAYAMHSPDKQVRAVLLAPVRCTHSRHHHCNFLACRLTRLPAMLPACPHVLHLACQYDACPCWWHSASSHAFGCKLEC